MLRQTPGLDLPALLDRKTFQFFCICSRRSAVFRLFARADGFRNLFLIFPFIFLWCMRDPLENGVCHRSQPPNDTTMAFRVSTILNPSLPIPSCAHNHSNISSQRIHFPVAWVDTVHPQTNRTRNNRLGSVSAPSRKLCIYNNTGTHWSAWSQIRYGQRQ